MALEVDELKRSWFRWLALVPLVPAVPLLFFGIIWLAAVQLVSGLLLVAAARQPYGVCSRASGKAFGPFDEGA